MRSKTKPADSCKRPYRAHWLRLLISPSEQVRLQAAKDILDRAGLKPTERIEQVTIEKSTDELRKELAQLMGVVTEVEDEDEPVTLN